MKKAALCFLSVWMMLSAALSGTALAEGPADVWSGVQSIEDVEAIYRFTLDGVEYTLPCQIRDFTANGWETGADLDSETVSGLTSASCWFEKEIDGADQTVTLVLLNANGDAVKASECRVTGIELNDTQFTDPTLFETAHGVTLGNSLEDAFAIYGPGDEQDPAEGELDYSFVKAYQGPDNNWYFLSVGMDTDTMRLSSSDEGVIDRIEMDYYKSMDSDSQQISPRPAYLDAYTAPEALGEKASDMSFEIDGVVYQMPVPVSAFIERGWQVEGDPVPGLRYGSVELVKDPEDSTSPTLRATVQNDSEKMVAPEDTYIKSFTVYDSDYVDLGFVLASGVKLGAPHEEVLAAIPQLAQVKDEEPLEEDGVEYRLSTSESWYCYYIQDRDAQTQISICIDSETDTVDWITMEAKFPAEQ